MTRHGLFGYFDSCLISLSVFDHEMTNHYSVDTDSPQYQLVHKKVTEAYESLKEIEFLIEGLEPPLPPSGTFGGPCPYKPITCQEDAGCSGCALAPERKP